VLSPLSRLVAALCLSVLEAVCSLAHAQRPSSEASLDEADLVRLADTVHPLARPENDRGPVPGSFRANRMLLALNSPVDRQQALAIFLRDAHSPASPHYHHWLTPEQFGANFGARDEDLQFVQSWLTSHGFAVTRLAKNRRYLEFSGTAAQIREALHSEVHQYEVNAKIYYSIASQVAIPRSIASLLKGFAPLNNFPLKSYSSAAGKATYSRAGGGSRPQFTMTANGAPFYAISPADFSTQYDIGPLYQAGIDGTGQTIGIIGESNLDLTITAAYRRLFGLPSDNTQIIIDGEDPGDGAVTSTGVLLSPNSLGYLEAEISGAVAPKATVNFYIAGGAPFQNVLMLAAIRAVEDNQAAVLSVSYGECEQLLGPSRDLFWATLWEQAAAQGQTVLVTSGDQGPSSCGAAIDANGQITYLGLSVNGIASTPWDVAVGATDFYYSDYATGGASVANAWNSTNGASFGSLRNTLPEQPWDDELGLNLPPPVFLQTGVGVSLLTGVLTGGEATGGGPSSCSEFSTQQGQTSYPYVCTGGYTKPAWQNAPGVPADGVRDLPDISVFGGDGRNLSAYAVCVESADCAPVTSGAPQVTLAGGTSAAAPAMAGIMALVNQKFGRQGQANFVLYALANQKPAIFHDITLGTNDVYCLQPIPSCITPPLGEGVPSFGVYAATPGYDLASGLGSPDVNALVGNWDKITFLPTATALQLTPSSVVHGTPVSIVATVKAASGATTPTGDVSLSTNAPGPPLNGPAITLVSGTATSNWSFFPGGSYEVTAQYAGDGTFATSASGPAALSVTPEPSSTALNLEYEYETATVPLLHIASITSGGQAPFGSRWSFTAQPSGQASQSTNDATGSATFSDGSTSATVPLNARGIATWSPETLALGAHSVTAAYSGDASYNPSSAGPVAFTVTAGVPRVVASLEAAYASLLPGPPTVINYQAGSTAVVHVTLAAVNSFVPPTGTVTVTFGTLTQTAAVASAVLANGTIAQATSTFPNIPAGTYTLTVAYNGDANWAAATLSPSPAYTFVATTASPTTTTLSLSPSSVDSSGVVKFTATVTSTQAPQIGSFGLDGAVTLFANGYPFAAISTLAPPATPSVATGTISISAGAIPSGSDQITATFQGSNDYMSSTSAPVALSVTYSDFTLSPALAVAVKSGGSAIVPLLLGGPNGGSAAITLACLPSGNFSCSISPSSLTVKGSTTASLTVNAYQTNVVAVASDDGDGLRRALLTCAAGCTFAFGLLFALPHRKSRRTLRLCCALLAALAVIAGCGSSGSSIINPPPPQKINTPPGNYSVVVTATSGAITHNAKVSVVVQ
jgi:hypothetical protein